RKTAGRRVIAIDGKTIRGARTKTATAPHLIAALDHHAGVVLGQHAVAAKSNEIPAVRDLLASFDPADLRGCVITLDAMHTQADTAEAILEAGADYVFTVKANRCATRRSVVSPPQAGGTRREVLGSDGLPGAERAKGTEACQKTDGQVQAFGMVRRGTRVTWRELDCPNPNLQRMQLTSIGKAPETDARLALTVLVRPGHPSRRERRPARAVKEMSGAPKSRCTV
ncbi:MAG: ISAs1 family transposase, partial [Thermocrispum sp.]